LPPDGELIFPLVSKALRRVLGRIRADVTVHGFRSTFRDWALEQTAYPSEMCELALAHVTASKTELAYRRADMVAKRRALMQEWSEYCGREKIAVFRKIRMPLSR
jgi:integrase